MGLVAESGPLDALADLDRDGHLRAVALDDHVDLFTGLVLA